MYLDATAAIPHVNLENDNDSSGSHPLENQQAPQQAVLVEKVLTNGDAHSLEQENVARGESGTAAGNNLSNDINSTFGGCTPGLRRRRQGADKYATDTIQLGLKFQRRRRHMAGNHDGSTEDEDKSSSPAILNGVVPLAGEDEGDESKPLTIVK